MTFDLIDFISSPQCLLSGIDASSTALPCSDGVQSSATLHSSIWDERWTLDPLDLIPSIACRLPKPHAMLDNRRQSHYNQGHTSVCQAKGWPAIPWHISFDCTKMNHYTKPITH
jgi:hypothetical protein